MTKLSLSDVTPDEDMRMLSLGSAHSQAPAHVMDDERTRQPAGVYQAQKLDAQATTGIKIVRPMLIHRYRHG